jgi:hypothetical protein
MRKSRQIKILIDKSIKIGDVVSLKDGSALSSVDLPEKEFYIMLPYPQLTKSELKLSHLSAVVIEAGIKDIVCMGSYEWCYLQDIVIDINGAKFRTASQCVYKKQ